MVGNFIASIIQGLGSKKLAAGLSAAVAAFLVPVLNKALHLGLDPAQVATWLGAVVGPIVVYIAAQWHVDVASEGKTTTAALVTQKALATAAQLLPKNTVAERLADALAKALESNPDAVGSVAAALGTAASVASPSSGPSPR